MVWLIFSVFGLIAVVIVRVLRPGLHLMGQKPNRSKD